MEHEILQLGGPHLKACKCCGLEFYGRRNQKFIDTTHKANYNNQKNAVKREKLSPVFKKMATSYYVMENYQRRDMLDRWIHITDLIKEGFDANIPTNLIKSKTDGKQFYKLLEYAFRLSEDGTKIIIHQLKS